VNGRQYIVIAAGGGKSPAPQGAAWWRLRCRSSLRSVTMQRMFTRRTFVSMTAASLAARALPAQETTQSPAPHTQISPQFSVMIGL